MPELGAGALPAGWAAPAASCPAPATAQEGAGAPRHGVQYMVYTPSQASNSNLTTRTLTPTRAHSLLCLPG